MSSSKLRVEKKKLLLIRAYACLFILCSYIAVEFESQKQRRMLLQNKDPVGVNLCHQLYADCEVWEGDCSDFSVDVRVEEGKKKEGIARKDISALSPIGD